MKKILKLLLLLGCIALSVLVWELTKSTMASMPNENLLNAVALDDPRKIDEALTKGADMDGKPYSSDSEGVSPFCEAIRGRRYKAVNAFIRHGVDVNRPDGFGSPLLSAADIDDTGLLAILIAHGAKVNDSGGNSESLWRAAVRANTLSVVALLEHGANPNTRYITTGQTATSVNEAARFLGQKSTTELIELAQHQAM